MKLYDLVESVISLGSIVPIRLPCSESVIPGGSDPAETVYDNTLSVFSATATIESVLGISAVSVPTFVGVLNAIPISI